MNVSCQCNIYLHCIKSTTADRDSALSHLVTLHKNDYNEYHAVQQILHLRETASVLIWCFVSQALSWGITRRDKAESGHHYKRTKNPSQLPKSTFLDCSFKGYQHSKIKTYVNLQNVHFGKAIIDKKKNSFFSSKWMTRLPLFYVDTLV